MNKLNRKGFTLVELLAVIIVLAIVVGISIPAVLGTISNSKNKACGVAVEAAQKYLENQLLVYNTDTSSADQNFIDFYTATNTTTLSAAQIKAIGLKAANVTTVTAKAGSDGTVCVAITKIPKTSEYYSADYWSNSQTTGESSTHAIPSSTAKNKSSHCS